VAARADQLAREPSGGGSLSTCGGDGGDFGGAEREVLGRDVAPILIGPSTPRELIAAQKRRLR
jgi:hypothetical protein